MDSSQKIQLLRDLDLIIEFVSKHDLAELIAARDRLQRELSNPKIKEGAGLG